VSVDGFSLSGSALAGLAIALEARVTARRGRIAGNTIGINLMIPDYDLDLLYDGVVLQGNRIDVARDEMPIPDASQVLSDLPPP
jgi:hypothetical protein